MSGVFPNNGVPPGQTTNGLENPDIAPGCQNLYYAARCNPRIDPFAMNAFISEFIGGLNCMGITYDCTRLDNLCRAFQQLLALSTQYGGAPAAFLQDQRASGVAYGSMGAGSWITRVINTIVRNVDNVITLGGNQFTPAVAGWVVWQFQNNFSIQSQGRLFNVTNNVAVSYGVNVYGSSSSEDPSGSLNVGGGQVEAGKTYAIQNFLQSAGNGGGATNAEMEVYLNLRFWPVYVPPAP